MLGIPLALSLGVPLSAWLGAFALIALRLGIGAVSPAVVYLCVAVWGLSFGGAPTLLQTALADTAGDGADVAQSMLVTVFNLAFAGSGAIGGVLLATSGAQTLPWVVSTLLLIGGAVAWGAKTHGFKGGRRG